MQPHHLGLAQLVNLRRIQVQGGVFPNLRAVVVGSVGQIRGGKRRARPRHVLVAHEFQQLHISRLHELANDLQRLGSQGLAFRLGNRRHLDERGVEETLLRLCVCDRCDRCVSALHRDTRWRESSLQSRTHLAHLLMEITWQVSHLRDPMAVVRWSPERPSGGIADIGPESGIRIRGHLVIAETLIRDEDFDLRPIDVEVDAFRRRELRTIDLLQFAEDVLPVRETCFLPSGIDLGELGGNRTSGVPVVRKLVVTPLPFGSVDVPEPTIGALRVWWPRRRRTSALRPTPL